MTTTSYFLYEADVSAPIPVYMGNGHSQTWFSSVESARNSNCHDEYKDRVKYKVGRANITTTIDVTAVDLDPPNEKELADDIRKKEFDARIETIMAVWIKEHPDSNVHDLMLHEWSVRTDLRLIDIINVCVQETEK